MTCDGEMCDASGMEAHCVHTGWPESACIRIVPLVKEVDQRILQRKNYGVVGYGATHFASLELRCRTVVTKISSRLSAYRSVGITLWYTGYADTVFCTTLRYMYYTKGNFEFRVIQPLR